MAILYGVSTVVLTAAKLWSMVAFSITFGAIYGGLVSYHSVRIRDFFRERSLNTYPVFLLLAILVSVCEEAYVHILGNSVAVSNIWLDMIIVPGEWSVWFTAWYFLMSRRYFFNGSQVLLIAGLSGLLYEYLGNLYFLANPLGFMVEVPTTVVIYASIFVLPMQLMNFTGDRDSWIKYPAGIFLPYLLSLPMDLFLRSVLGI